MAGHQQRIGAGVIIGSNVINLAACSAWPPSWRDASACTGG
jgi:hypothetical protein